MIKFTATRIVPSECSGTMVGSGWFSVSHHWVASKKLRRVCTGHWFRIRSGSATIFRVLRFNAALEHDPNLQSGEIVLDYDGWLELSDFAEDTSKRLPVELEEARWYEYLHCIVKHPDPAYRLSGWLGIISVALGVLGIILGLLAFWPR